MSIEFLVATAVGVMSAAGIYLVLRARTFPVVLGLAFMSYAINVFLFASGRVVINQPPIWGKDVTAYSDPLPQALVLTAIVIAFGMTALVVVLALRTYLETGVDQVDGLADPPGQKPPPPEESAVLGPEPAAPPAGEASR
ncbi:MAG: Na+/H+ antiporter subunit C [Phenylobacterium sp.]|nr:Na+/H+ antiporter subunit C [Phenylobacterium sp.]MDP2215149.1 Na+/H+ antiporter subunit C [Phenylobacterium sp.]